MAAARRAELAVRRGGLLRGPRHRARTYMPGAIPAPLPFVAANRRASGSLRGGHDWVPPASTGLQSAQSRVEVAGDLRVALSLRLDVRRRELDDAEPDEGLSNALAEEPDAAQGRYDTAEELLPEDAVGTQLAERLDTGLPGKPEVLPDLPLLESIAQHLATLDDELLALAALGIGQLRISSRRTSRPNATCRASSCITYAWSDAHSGSFEWSRVRWNVASASPSMRTCMLR